MKALILFLASAFFLASCETTSNDEEQGGGERVELEQEDQSDNA